MSSSCGTRLSIPHCLTSSYRYNKNESWLLSNEIQSNRLSNGTRSVVRSYSVGSFAHDASRLSSIRAAAAVARASEERTDSSTSVVPTPVAVVNGDEDEEKEYEARCTLYQLREGKWGAGPVRVVQAKTDQKALHVVVRREICLHDSV